jgi:hypothetical protein
MHVIFSGFAGRQFSRSFEVIVNGGFGEVRNQFAKLEFSDFRDGLEVAGTSMEKNSRLCPQNHPRSPE